jgi:hypothetical protein
MIGGPQFYDVVSRMKQFGFVVYDMWGLNYRPFDNALVQVDMAFVREEGAFRGSHVFATLEQRKAFAWNLDSRLATLAKK